MSHSYIRSSLGKRNYNTNCIHWGQTIIKYTKISTGERQGLQMSPTTEDLKGWNNSRIKPNFKIQQMDSAQEINLPKETIYKNGLKKVTELTLKESVEDRFSSVQFSHSVVSNSLRPHELQHARPPCPSPTLGVHPNSSPSSWWCHPAISSSVVPFSSCP